ncbi:MAG: histidinol-phosphatase HisJ family protein [Candidatus Lokiarchaeota archaeon]|nr:histidinol-phosphatase HisJ family protein [Candidatus Lokiarchaeota archaeon]
MKFKYTDYHVHTNWSLDIEENGPKFEDYIAVAEENRINVCFLEHYELYYLEKDKNTPFHDENIYNYLEEIDTLKETYDFILSGLEIDYYPEKETQLREFMDDNARDIDFIAGTIHEWIPNYPITLRDKIIELLEKIPMKQIINEYFEVSESLIRSKIFKNICHIDTVFRYINENDIIPEDDCDVSDDLALKLGRLCIENDVRIEYNLSGRRFPINRPFPSRDVISKLKKEGGKVFVGSDSHKISYFKKTIPDLKKAYDFLSFV